MLKGGAIIVVMKKRSIGLSNRREFIKTNSSFLILPILQNNIQGQGGGGGELPWYRKAYRWGQTNINEKDPNRYDIGWWREHWRRTRVQGLVINAGGIVAYYPSRYQLHYRPQALGDRDLLGELVQVAHEDGLAVLARMDSNRAHEDFYRAHQDWFAVNKEGEPYRAGDLYITCINSPYYDEYIPDILREIIGHADPEGITDNSWSGLDRNSICYCEHCSRRFREVAGELLPPGKDWTSPVYRKWIQWNFQRRLEVWDLNNRVSREAGGRDCLWIGMIGGNMVSQGRRFRDVKAICQRAELIMFDDQGRSDDVGFQSNSEMGKRIHGLLGWEKLIPESMAMYQRGPTFRKAANPKAEARMWMLEGFAGGIQPWWHHVGAYQEDRRQFQTAEPIYRWYEKNQAYMVNRKPIASVGVVWSQQNVDFYGQDEAVQRAILPYRGIIQALIRARIPYLPVHVDHIDREAPNLSLAILPNLAAVSDKQLSVIRRFHEKGGSLIASGVTALFNEWGEARRDFGLGDLFGVAATGEYYGAEELSSTQHSYLRLHPDLGENVYGPKSGAEPDDSPARHPVLKGFEETNILAFGGRLEKIRVTETGDVPITLIPEFPIYPPETSWMRKPRTEIPALVLRTRGNQTRLAYLAADIDRRFAQHNLPDHGDLLTNLIRWADNGRIPLEVNGPGLIDCQLYRQGERLILHLVNLTSAGTWRSPVHELIPVGPFEVRLRIPAGVEGKHAKAIVSDRRIDTRTGDGWCRFRLESILDHEVAVID